MLEEQIILPWAKFPTAVYGCRQDRWRQIAGCRACGQRSRNWATTS